MAFVVNPHKAAVRDILKRGRADPVWFIEEVIGNRLWETQKAIVRAVFTQRRVAVRSCHSSGKTFTCAQIVIAFFYLWPGCKILTTAPTWLGVEKLLWSEIAAAHRKLLERYPDMGGTLTTTQLRHDENWWAMGLSTNDGVRFQGHHAPRMLIILDEAMGVAPDIWEAAEGNSAGGIVHWCVIGNPVIPSGPFYDCFTTHRATWTTFGIDAFDTPNLQGLTPQTLLALPDAELDLNPFPHLTTRRWVRDRLLDWGEDSPAWQSRVRGQFPTQSEDSLIALSWLERANQPADDPGGPVIAGVDVAGPGEDETVLAVRCGPALLGLWHWTKPDAAGDVVAALGRYLGRIESVNVDSAGIGYHFATQVRTAMAGVDVRFVNVGEATRDPEKYKNLKAELYWSLRDRFREGDLTGLTDPTTISQLASIRYEHDSRGRVVIESKEDARKRGVKSPDRAEAVLLAYAARSRRPYIRVL